ncbi:MAG: hypothetical protein Aurels2KO_29650 [Aureliella sp.]
MVPVVASDPRVARFPSKKTSKVIPSILLSAFKKEAAETASVAVKTTAEVFERSTVKITSAFENRKGKYRVIAAVNIEIAAILVDRIA